MLLKTTEPTLKGLEISWHFNLKLPSVVKMTYVTQSSYFIPSIIIGMQLRPAFHLD